MLLSQWVENKKDELIKSKTYKSIEFVCASNIDIARDMTSETFEFGRTKIAPMDTEVEDFVREELTTTIKGLRVTFDVIKPRCRKPVKLYLFVKLV